MLAFVIALLTIVVAAADSSAYIVFGGFSWAENLAFDGLGGLFVSDAVRGELWKIVFNETSSLYDGQIFLKEGATQFGGLAITNDGLHIYAGAVLEDKSMALIKASTAVPTAFVVLTSTPHLANGLAGDFKRGVIYFTDEGTGEKMNGTVSAYNLNTGKLLGVVANVPSADGAFFDAENDKLYVGELVSKKVRVFSVTDSGISLDSVNIALSDAVSSLHIMDDLTLDRGLTNMTEVGKTILFGADWTGRKIQKFTLDGSSVSEVEAPNGVTLKEPTSVRWGRGKGFDAHSLYVSEGGGLTKLEHGRRIVQIPVA